VAPVLLKVATLVPVDERPDKGVVLASCKVAVVDGTTIKLEVVPAVLVV
jgi:hypothetical protein